MSIFQKRRAQNLSEWLHIATKKLAPAAKDRICADITSHYDEAVEEHIQSGLPMCAAQAAALAGLGDATTAARRFRQTHLTESEFRVVTTMSKPNRLNSPRQFSKMLFCFSGGCALYAYKGFNVMVSLVIALFIANHMVIFVLARRKSPRGILLLEAVSYVNLAILFTLSVCAWDGHLGVCLFMLANSVLYFRLHNKLGKAAEDWMGAAGTARSEIPPDKPIAS